MRRKILLFLLLACACSPACFAANESYNIWNGTDKTAVAPAGDVYDVVSAAELAWIADQDDDFAGKTIVLRANIDLNGKFWTPIGTAAKPFKGTFKGKGHLIKGLHLFNATDGVGLFGHVAQGATIDSLGISGSELVAKNKRRVGTIAGVCGGTVKQCWSMAQIVVAGNVAGGLVGELTATGSITDAYNAGLIFNANDTIGGIVGRNIGGTLTRVFNTGYAKNGKAIVGDDRSGVYTECFYDRKLYYQQSGITADQSSAIDITRTMFTLFADQAVWSTGADRYPVLTAFANTDAALLSAAPMFIETEGVDPVNHANDLTMDFTLSTEGGITWTCQDNSADQWIHIDGEDVTVTRPCSETDVLVDSKLRNELRVVYMRPRRTEDLLPGLFTSFDRETGALDVVLGFCYDSYEELAEDARMGLATQGWLGDGDYTYLVERWVINEALMDTSRLDTLLLNANTEQYQTWFDTCHIRTKEMGHYLIRSFVKDNGCVNGWLENPKGVEYIVFGEFIPGEIVTKTDTVILTEAPVYVNAASKSESVGGAGEITYQWFVNGDSIHTQTGLNLVNYPVSTPNTYVFTRGTRDEQCYVPEYSLAALGVYTVHAYAAFDAGEVEPSTDTTFCTVEDAQAFTVTATAATGGVDGLGYSYQWYQVNGTDSAAVTGAISEDLPLSGVSLTAGGTYTFVRKAKDNTRFTQWTVSRESRTIHIMAQLNPGAITNGALDDYCAPASATASTAVPVKISEVTAATGDTGIEYRWTWVEGNVTVGNEPNLNTSFLLGDIVGTTLTFYREVRNPGCEWSRSTGIATLYVGQDTHEDVSFTVCDSDMPYVMTWIDGSKHTFNKDGDSWTVSDTKSGRCAADTTFTISVAAIPNFHLDEFVSWCQTTGSMTVYYEEDPGAPSNVFYIRYSEDLKAYMHAADTTGAITTPGAIVFNNMPNLGTGDLYLTVQIGFSANSSEGTCFSRSHQMRLYPSLGGYVYSKYDRVVFVDNNPKNGALPESTEKLQFVSYQWYKNGVLQEGATGQYYHEGGAELNGVFYCMLKDTKDNSYRTCDIVLPAESKQAAPQATAVYPIPASAGEALTIEGYGKARILSFAGECVTTVERIDGQIAIPAPRVAGMYYVEITAEDGSLEIHKLIVK